MTAYHSASHTRAGEQCDTRARFDAIDLARKDEEAIVGLKVTLMDVDGWLKTVSWRKGYPPYLIEILSII